MTDGLSHKKNKCATREREREETKITEASITSHRGQIKLWKKKIGIES
jgi:hypothetical protein